MLSFGQSFRQWSMLVARSFSTAAAILAALVTVIGGALEPGHSHVSNYISELGARSAAHGELVSLWGFLPISYVKGRAMTIYFSYDPAATGPASLLTSIRWGRLFRQVH